jgi:hypothetical protein
MEKILNVIKDYDIEILGEVYDDQPVFACRGRQSGITFHLDMNWNRTNEFAKYKNVKGIVLYIMIVNNNLDEIIQRAETFDENQGRLLVFDPEDDIQFFSKDFYNLYVTMM